jgi:hypothetical protein
MSKLLNAALLSADLQVLDEAELPLEHPISSPLVTLPTYNNIISTINIYIFISCIGYFPLCSANNDSKAKPVFYPVITLNIARCSRHATFS